MDAGGFTGPQVAFLSPHDDHACAAAEFCGLVDRVAGVGEQSWRDRLESAHDRDLFSIGAKRATQRLAVLAHEGCGRS